VRVRVRLSSAIGFSEPRRYWPVRIKGLGYHEGTLVYHEGTALTHPGPSISTEL